MASKSKQKNGVIGSNNPHISKKWYLIAAAVVLVAVVALGYFVVTKYTNTAKNSTPKNVLTAADLENPDVELNSKTSNASVDNLTSELQAKIDKQIAAKENPIDTVKTLAGVLSNTTNEKRQDQLTSFIENFLTKHVNALWFKAESGKPDQAQVNYWKAELYAKLVYNYQFMMLNKFTGTDGKPIDTTQEQLKYIDLYLALANDPKSHIAIAEEDKEFIADYQYDAVNDFLQIKNNLDTGRNNG